MFNQQDNLFYEICSKVNNKVYFQSLITKQHSFFDIQPFKIDKLYSQIAKKLYNLIRFKQIYFLSKRYQVSKQYIINPTFWYENERKIFIWFIVCYFHQNQLNTETQHQIDWQLFSNLFFNKNISFLQFQFKNILKQKHRISWTDDEDRLLVKATEVQGSGCWNEISKNLYFSTEGKIFKSPKHCRQRWLNHLDRTKNKGKWTDEQDFLMLTFIRENGKKWSRISQLLNHTRTQHMVKNRFNSLMTKIRKNKKQKQQQTINKVLLLLEENKQKQSTNQRQVKEKHQNKRTCFNYSSDDEQIQQNYDQNQQQQEYKSSSENQQRNQQNNQKRNQQNNEQRNQQKNKNKLQIQNSENRKQQQNGNYFIKVKKSQQLPNIEVIKNESVFSKEDALKSNQMNVGFYNFFVQLPTVGESNLRPGMVFFYHMPWLGSDKMSYYPIQSIQHLQQQTIESPFSFNLPSQLYKTQPVHIIQHNRN